MNKIINSSRMIIIYIEIINRNFFVIIIISIIYYDYFIYIFILLFFRRLPNMGYNVNCWHSSV